MIATGTFANILSERAALLAVVAGAVTTVAEEEPDDGLGLEEEVKVASEEPVEVPEVTETVGSGIEELELLNTVEDVLPEAEVLEEVAAEVGSGENVMGPGPRLNRRINKRISIANGSTGSDLR